MFFLFSLFLTFYFFFQTSTIYGGDGGDLVASAFVGGFAHPPGYPLYSILGHILTYIPIGTVAWRVALLSTIPSALTLTIVYVIVYKITSSKISSLLSSMLLGSSYIFWLYSIVPEVFALNALFTVLYILLAILFYQKPKKIYIYLAALLTGATFAHHHMAIFIYPSLIYILVTKKNFIKTLKKSDYVKSALFFLLTASTYLWVVYAAFTIKPIIWNDPVNIKNFIFLITRAQYGTFFSSINFGNTLTGRLIQLPAIGEFYATDFTLPGVFIGIIGLIYLFRFHRVYSKFLLLGFIFSGPIFFFYGSYILFTSFSVGILERFLIMSYIYIAIFFGCGITLIQKLIYRLFISKITNPTKSKIYAHIVSSFFIIVPILIFYINFPKLYPLKNDQTAEKFGRDIINTAEKKSILLLQGDNPFFNSLYIYHTEKKNYPSIKILSLNKLIAGDYSKYIKKYYPDISYSYLKDDKKFIRKFIDDNYKVFPIYSTKEFDVYDNNAVWVPQGIIFRYYRRSDLPTINEITSRNTRLWKNYQDPLEGSLGKYRNLMLSNVIDYYRNGRMKLGQLYILQKKYPEAIEQFNIAYKLDPLHSPVLLNIADANISLNECAQADKFLKNAFKLHKSDASFSATNYYILQYKLNKDCYKNEKKAKVWKKTLDTFEERKKNSLQELVK